MISKLIDRLFSMILPVRDEKEPRWEVDADYARIDQEPLRARILLYIGSMVFVSLLIWAAVAEIEEVTRGTGRVIPLHQIQVIQAVDGGVVSELAVQIGEIVAKGQLLLRIDPTRFISSLQENRSQYLALMAKAERLKALSEKRPFTPPEEVAAEGQELFDQERILYNSSLKELEVQLGIARLQLKQRNEEFREAETNHIQLNRRFELLDQELSITRPLVGSGAVSEIEILRLERNVIQTRGERDQVKVTLGRIKASIAEAKRKGQEVELSFFNRIRRELSEVQAKLGSLVEEEKTLIDRVQHADVKSPVRGTIKRLLVNTLGAVVQPGKEVIEIVPLDDALVLEAKIKPSDIAFLRPGLIAQVRFTAYDYAVYGSLDAKVEQIGADTVFDEKGNAFYMVRVRTLKPELGKDLPIIPGMVAQVDIITGKKSLLAYLLKPILRAKSNAFKER